MKDDRLEKQFDEYFKGVNTPDDITGDAKKHVKSKSTLLPKFVKFASVAASFVLVFAISLTLILRTGNSAAPPDNSGDISKPLPDVPGDSADVPDATDPGGPLFVTYDDLSFTDANAYEITDIDSSLTFIKKFAYSDKANVNKCTAGYLNDKLMLVKAELSVLDGNNRHDTQVYVEFTDENVVYSPLENYYNGTKGSYKGVNYYLTVETAENGEPVNKLQFTYKSVKYYFNVTSTDENSYIKYLQLIIK